MRRSRRNGGNEPALQFPLTQMAEREFNAVLDSLEAGVLHHSDRPEIELDILRLLDNSAGPTAEGIAAKMGVGVRAAIVHLEALRNANWAWSQPGYAHQMTWHISLEGRHYLAEHGCAEWE